MWRDVLPELAEHFTVVAPDLPGHGGSAKPRGDYSLGAFASSVRDILSALGHERATLVGQSLGGGVVMQFAYQFPERDRAARAGVERRPRAGGQLPAARAHTARRATSCCRSRARIGCTTPGSTVAGWLRNVGFRPSPHLVQIWESYGSLAEPETRAAFLQTLRSVVDQGGQRVSATNRLYLASRVPTLIVWGDHDRIIPVDQGYEAHDAIPGSRLEIFERCRALPALRRARTLRQGADRLHAHTSPAHVLARPVPRIAPRCQT